jgi:hypothetical protein
MSQQDKLWSKLQAPCSTKLKLTLPRLQGFARKESKSQSIPQNVAALPTSKAADLDGHYCAYVLVGATAPD